jgi:hypothetical protein
MTHTRPSATAEATSWRAVGAGALVCQVGATAGAVVVVGAVVGGRAVVVVVLAAGAAGVEPSLQDIPSRSRMPASRRVVTAQRYVD